MWVEQLLKELMIAVAVLTVLAFGLGYGCHYLVTKAPAITIKLEHKK